MKLTLANLQQVVGEGEEEGEAHATMEQTRKEMKGMKGMREKERDRERERER